MKPLTPGSVARIYRDGTLVAPAVNIPADGRMELRHLQPGQYELRDECGGQGFIEVTHATEVVVVGDPGSSAAPVAAADSTRPQEPSVADPAPEPIYPDPQESASIEKPDPSWRATLPVTEGVEAAGSAGEQPHPAVVGQSELLNVGQLRDALRELGKPVSGTKAELVARLEGRDGEAE